MIVAHIAALLGIHHKANDLVHLVRHQIMKCEDIKTKLLVVASTYSPLQGHILYSLLPPLASPHSAWLSVPAAGPLHSCSLHLQGSSFLLLLSLSLNAVLSLAPLSP